MSSCAAAHLFMHASAGLRRRRRRAASGVDLSAMPVRRPVRLHDAAKNTSMVGRQAPAVRMIGCAKTSPGRFDQLLPGGWSAARSRGFRSCSLRQVGLLDSRAVLRLLLRHMPAFELTWMLRNSSRSTVPIMNGRAAGLPAAPGCINMALRALCVRGRRGRRRCHRSRSSRSHNGNQCGFSTGRDAAVATPRCRHGDAWDVGRPPLGGGRCSLGGVLAHRLIARFCLCPPDRSHRAAAMKLLSGSSNDRSRRQQAARSGCQVRCGRHADAGPETRGRGQRCGRPPRTAAVARCGTEEIRLPRPQSCRINSEIRQNFSKTQVTRCRHRQCAAVLAYAAGGLMRGGQRRLIVQQSTYCIVSVLVHVSQANLRSAASAVCVCELEISDCARRQPGLADRLYQPQNGFKALPSTETS